MAMELADLTGGEPQLPPTGRESAEKKAGDLPRAAQLHARTVPQVSTVAVEAGAPAVFRPA